MKHTSLGPCGTR